MIAYDSEPERVIGTQMARDGAVGSDDRIEILLDTFRDQRSAFYFATNPAGALVDGLAFANGQLNTEWDAIWNVRTSRTDARLDRRVRDSFQEPQLSRGEDDVGIQRGSKHLSKARGRSLVRRSPRDAVSAGVGSGGDHQPGGLTQGIALDVRPFIAGRWLHLGSAADDDFSQKPGLDLFYNVTPSLKLTATFNTDFGETEVDARQINLSRFSLLFPEKRSFFLEGAGVFSFASTGPEVPGGIPATGADVYPVLQPAGRSAVGAGGADRCGRQADGHGRPDRCWRARRAYRRSEAPATSSKSTRRTSSSAASSATCSDSPTSVRCSPTVIRRSGNRARPTARTCVWRRRVFSAGPATSS